MGRVLNWDPEELAEHSSPERFRRSFTEIAPSVEAWLEEWVASETLAERQERILREAREQALRNMTRSCADGWVFRTSRTPS